MADEPFDGGSGDPAQDERLVRGRFWNKARQTLGRVPFTEQAVAAYYCATDGTTPAHVKAILMGALAYFIVPTDMIPDFIAGLGFTDDAVVLAAAMRTIASHLSDGHVAAARRFLDKEPE
jgi:uncharacterized membrane protein YkvA (DUF1232 family)